MNTIGKSDNNNFIPTVETQAVTWDTDNDHNVAYNGAEVLKPEDAENDWNSYTHSVQTITRSDIEFQGVTFQVVASQASNNRGGSMVGLGDTTIWSTSPSFSNIQFALFDFGSYNGGSQRIYEDGTFQKLQTPTAVTLVKLTA